MNEDTLKENNKELEKFVEFYNEYHKTGCLVCKNINLSFIHPSGLTVGVSLYGPPDENNVVRYHKQVHRAYGVYCEKCGHIELISKRPFDKWNLKNDK